jgi:choice-of-anchor B domain-containing protein
MNKLLLLLLLSPVLGIAQQAQNISLYAKWEDSSVTAEPNFALKYNSVWGYAQAGKEYAIVGSTKGTHIVEVTDPANPVQRDFVAGRRGNCVWREFKTYNNYLYMVSDDGAPNSLQIMDLSYLPDSVHVVYDSNTMVERAHTIFIDGDKMYLAVPKGPAGNYSMAVYSLANPASPVFLRALNQDYSSIGSVHDMYVRNDTIYASAANQGLHIYRLTASNTFSELATYTSYPDAGYNHSSALTENGDVLVFADEVPAGLSLKAINVSNLGNITLLDVFNSGSTATPHNPYIKGNDHAVVAYYADGIQVFNISNPTNVVKTGWYDTDPLNDGGNANYQGCWGAYIDLPSGIMLASDMQKGLFVLDASIAMGIKPKEKTIPVPVAYPVPFGDKLTIDFQGMSNDNASLVLFDMSGKLILEESKNNSKSASSFVLNTSNLPVGLYIAKLFDGKDQHIRKVVKY